MEQSTFYMDTTSPIVHLHHPKTYSFRWIPAFLLQLRWHNIILFSVSIDYSVVFCTWLFGPAAWCQLLSMEMLLQISYKQHVNTVLFANADCSYTNEIYVEKWQFLRIDFDSAWPAVTFLCTRWCWKHTHTGILWTYITDWRRKLLDSVSKIASTSDNSSTYFAVDQYSWYQSVAVIKNQISISHYEQFYQFHWTICSTQLRSFLLSVYWRMFVRHRGEGDSQLSGFYSTAFFH